MCKIILSTCCLLFSIFLLPVTAEGSQPAYSTGVLRVVINNETVSRVIKPVIVNHKPYIPLRAAAEYMGGAVSWDAEREKASVDYSGQRFFVKGVILNNSLMVPPEQVARIFNKNIYIEPSFTAVSLTCGPSPAADELFDLLPCYKTYSHEDIYWLSRIVEAEARGESYESRLAVANVVLNRLAAPQYPDTVKDVIFDRKHGVQFTPTKNGAINREPTIISRMAALDALDGFNNAPGALFFLSPALATNFWIQENRQYAFTIGGHAYYY
jgi:N-acetylmuramoyl-L-alanine amidase